jgi:hypothetical protein
MQGCQSLRKSRSRQRSTRQSRPSKGNPVCTGLTPAPFSSLVLFISAGIAGGVVDRLVETKGVGFFACYFNFLKLLYLGYHLA